MHASCSKTKDVQYIYSFAFLLLKSSTFDSAEDMSDFCKETTASAQSTRVLFCSMLPGDRLFYSRLCLLSYENKTDRFCAPFVLKDLKYI